MTASNAPAKLVLFADDDEGMRKLLERRLASWGYQVLLASDGVDVIRLAKDRLPSLILLDVMMPGLDGLEVCRILTREKDTRHIPVILLSAKATQISGEELRAAGALTAVQKPYQPEELLRLIEQTIPRTPA